jgi:Tol biopolymer transport system component
MVRRFGFKGRRSLAVAFSLASVFLAGAMAAGAEKSLVPGTGIDTKSIPYKIVYESLRQTQGKENWELILIDADGSNPVNLTNTPEVGEIYPHASPDGTKVCFEANEGSGKEMVRSVYYMNLDGTGRVKVAHNARQPCWSPDSRTIAFLKGEFERYTITDYATKGVHFYDLQTGKTTEHSNCANLYHLYNLCWSADGKWFTATVHGGMDFKHAILAFPVEGSDIINLGIGGCRPDFSADNKMVTWGLTDWDLCVAAFEAPAGKPQVTAQRTIVKCEKTHEVYHTDWSPDGRYLTFSYGPKAQEMGGGPAPGWNICIADLTGKWVQITTDGNHNKEPDWVPAAKTN